MRSLTTVCSLALFAAAGCADDDFATPLPSPFPEASISLEYEVLTEGLAIPFDVAVLSDDEFFVTDRVGKLFRYSGGSLVEITGMPVVTTFGDPGIPAIMHGGLMDIELHPGYPDVPWLYISFFSEGFLRVERFQVQGNTATDFEPIFTSRTEGYYGNGARIVWHDDQHFFLNIGGSTLSTVSDPDLISQDLDEDWGKIHRLRDDGSIPDTNPILPELEEPTSIWSYGHRDAQGLYFDAEEDVLFAVEHGPKGGDEFNVIEPGGNYGWPLFTYGIDYSGMSVSTITEAEASETTVLPEHHWTIPTDDGGQAIAPAFLLGVRQSNFGAWNGKFLLSSLFYRWLLLYDRQTDTTEALPLTGRIRSAAQLPGGNILILRERTRADSTDGQLIRLSPL
ncbi:MAG: PQQ-dependent sugar dehydrogenase [Myxococcota bacterium]